MAEVVFAVGFVGALGSLKVFRDIPYFAASWDAPSVVVGLGCVEMHPHFSAGISSQYPT